MESLSETTPIITSSTPRTFPRDDLLWTRDYHEPEATKVMTTSHGRGFVYVGAGILIVFVLIVVIGIWYFSRPGREEMLGFIGNNTQTNQTNYMNGYSIDRQSLQSPTQSSNDRHRQYLDIAQDHHQVYLNQTNESMDPSIVQDAVACQRLGSTVWDNTRQTCSCREPFTGPLCNHERYDPNYRFIGLVEDGDLLTEVNFASPLSVDRLSYPGDTLTSDKLTCTQACDADPTCSGVIWKSGPPLRGSNIDNCVLLHENPVMGRNQAINLPRLRNNPSQQSYSASHELFLKQGNRPHYLDRVILHNCDQERDLPDRWYLVDSYNNGSVIMTTVYEETPKHLTMIPRNAINDGLLIGVFSCRPIDVTTAKAIINSGYQSTDGFNPEGTACEVNRKIGDRPVVYDHTHPQSIRNNQSVPSNLKPGEWIVRTPGQPLDLPTTWNDLWVVYLRDSQWFPPTMLRGGPLGFGGGGDGRGATPSRDAVIIYRLPPIGDGQSLPPNWFEMTAYRNPQTGFQIQRIQSNIPTRVDFVPTQQQTIGTPHCAVWSSQPLTLEEARQALAQAQRTQKFIWQDSTAHDGSQAGVVQNTKAMQGRQWYVSCAGQRFSLPLSLMTLASQGIYVTYLNEN